ncbi:hypothetical protein V6N13_128554 [Hibiscus sabdariffa]
MENGARPMSGTLGKYNIVGGLENEFNAGVLLGPTLMHGTEWLALYIHPFDKTLLLETMGSLGVTFYMFLAGLEMDLTPIRKMEKTAYSVAIVGIILPGCGGMILYHLVRNDRKDAPKEGGIFWAITLSITSLPDLAQILSKLKLLSTDLGKTAMTSAVLTDLVSWILLAATVAVVNGQGDYLRIVPTLIFVLYGLVATVIIVASLIKILSTLLVCTCLKFSFRDSLALGVLMNTKGVIAIIVLHEGRNLKVKFL